MSSLNLPTHNSTTTLLIPNMHCPSCVETISLLLDIPRIQNLNVSLLLRSITFNIDGSVGGSKGEQTADKAVADVVAILSRDGGFLVEHTGPNGPSAPLPPTVKREEGLLGQLTKVLSSKKTVQRKREEERRKVHLGHCEACREGRSHDDEEPSSPLGKTIRSSTSTSTLSPADARSIIRTTLSIEGMTCASCTQSITSALSSYASIVNVDIDLLASSGTIRHRSDLTPEQVKELVEDTGFDAEIVSSIPEADPKQTISAKLLKTSVMIEGMTCASCSSAIHNALKEKPGIAEITIDLLGNKGTFIHTANITADELISAIEDIGYGAEVISSQPITETTGEAVDHSRQISVRVEGIYCGQCIKKLNTFLSTLQTTSTPFTAHNHITTITYEPRKPYTIRDILSGLSGVSPEFEAFVVKDRSLNDRSRDIQKREVTVLFIHWIIAFIFTIPTFIIAIIGMALLPSSDSFRHLWMRPVWGAANLGTIILWPLATVVQFGVGRLFYSRAFASMKPHIRRLIPRFIRPKPKVSPRPITWRSFFNFGSMDLLVVLSTSVSYFASLAMLILDVQANSSSMSVGTYFDSCVFLIMFILLGRVLEAYAKSRTTDAVSLLGQLRPETALLVEHDVNTTGSESTKAESEGSEHREQGEHVVRTTRQIPVELLERDDLILVPPGSLPPTDGIIVDGTSTFDESSLTGESKPVKKHPGDEIYTGTTNLSSAITIRITSLSGETMLEKIMRAVSEASGRKAPIEKLAERLTGKFVPIIVYLSLVVLAIWLSLGLTGTLHREDENKAGGTVFFAIEFAIATLVVACPCGIGLAVPCANAVGTGLFAKNGILASGGGEAFLGATKLDTIILDKTGTLTVGKSTVTDTMAWAPGTANPGNDRDADESAGADEGVDSAAVERMVREVERGSTHPLAQGIVNYLDNRLGTSEEPITIIATEEKAGRGVKATIKTGSTIHHLLIGNLLLLADHSTSLSPEQTGIIDKWSEEAKSVVLVAVASETSEQTFKYSLVAAFALSDPPRETTLPALNRLRGMGMNIMMLSGDNASTARAVGGMVGIDKEDIIAGVSPEGKAEVIRDIQGKIAQPKSGSGWRRYFGLRPAEQRRRVMFVGDGLNDSIALATADVSVAMGHGSQATLAGSDFVLLSSNLLSLPILIRLSHKITMRQKLNLGWAIIFNLVCLPFAAGVFYPAGGIRLTPVWSAVVMACSSLSVVCSSLALRWGL